MAKQRDNDWFFNDNADVVAQVYDLMGWRIESEAIYGPGQIPDSLNEQDGMLFNVVLDGVS